MPNANPIFRALDWGMILEHQMPEYISRYFPHGDPVDNRHEINTELNRLETLGPEGRRQMELYVKDEISHDEFIENINFIRDSINTTELARFQEQISIIKREMKYNPYHILPFISAFNMNSEIFEDALKELSKIDLYEYEPTIENEKVVV